VPGHARFALQPDEISSPGDGNDECAKRYGQFNSHLAVLEPILF